MAELSASITSVGSSDSEDSSALPEFYHFPPFFTLQPVLATREKQLKLWMDLVLEYHSSRKQQHFAWKEWSLWENPSIRRRLDGAAAKQVVDQLVKEGRAEWTDTAQTRLTLFFKSPAEVAACIFAWVKAEDRIGEVFTLYELREGDEVQGQEFYGLEEAAFRKAIAVLEREGKAELFRGDSSEEDGVKFFKPAGG